MSVIERRWIQKGYRIFFAIALLICVGGIPAYAEELVPDAGEITGRVLFISSYSYAWETVPEQIRGIKRSIGRWCTAGLSVYGYQKCRDGGE